MQGPVKRERWIGTWGRKRPFPTIRTLTKKEPDGTRRAKPTEVVRPNIERRCGICRRAARSSNPVLLRSRLLSQRPWNRRRRWAEFSATAQCTGGGRPTQNPPAVQENTRSGVGHPERKKVHLPTFYLLGGGFYFRPPPRQVQARTISRSRHSSKKLASPP